MRSELSALHAVISIRKRPSPMYQTQVMVFTTHEEIITGSLTAECLSPLCISRLWGKYNSNWYTQVSFYVGNVELINLEIISGQVYLSSSLLSHRSNSLTNSTSFFPSRLFVIQLSLVCCYWCLMVKPDSFWALSVWPNCLSH